MTTHHNLQLLAKCQDGEIHVCTDGASFAKDASIVEVLTTAIIFASQSKSSEQKMRCATFLARFVRCLN